MSLINQMLKDLEARRNQEQTERDLLLNLQATSSLSTSSFLPRNQTYIILSLLFLIFSLSLFFYFKKHSTTLSTNLSTQNLTSEIKLSPPPTDTLPAQLEDLHIDDANGATQITLLFSQPPWYSLEKDFKENKILLTIDNIDFSNICKSVGKIEECLTSLFPDNQENFFASIQASPEEKNQYRFLFTLPDNISLTNFNAEETSGKLTLTFDHLILPSNTKENLIIKKSAANLSSEEEEYRYAWNLIQKKQFAKGITHLELLLARNPNFKAARIDLSQLFIQLGRYNDAEQLIKEGKRLHLHDDTFIMMQARLLLAQNKPQDAQTLLQSFSPAFKTHLDYYALLAASFEKNQQPHSAIALYEKLLAEESSHAAWWLGLAMARETVDEKNSALEAYHQALTYQQLAPHVQGYIINRIHALGE